MILDKNILHPKALNFCLENGKRWKATELRRRQARSAATGDEGNLAGWLLALLISGCLAAGIVISYRKRNGNS